MKKYILIILSIIGTTLSANAQSRGVKIGYIDMEYILQNVPDYVEAKNQLEQKAQKWKQEIEIKQIELKKLIESLKTERVLLTKELIDEREEEIAFQTKEVLDYQDKRFGPRGDLIIQKTVLVQPVQDQVFTAAQDIAEAKKYDFIFDKTSDLTMLFAAKRYDISDQVIRVITRAAKRDQMTKKQLKAEEEKDLKLEQEENLRDNPALAERQKKLEERKAAREKLIADRLAERELKKQEILEARQKLLDEKENKKNGTVPANTNTEEGNKGNTDTLSPEEKRQQAAAERAQLVEKRKQELAEKRAKVLADREAAKKEREEKLKQDKENKTK